MTVPENAWKKSSKSGSDDNCVEVKIGADEVGVRDTKDRQGGQIDVPAAAWQAVIDLLRQA